MINWVSCFCLILFISNGALFGLGDSQNPINDVPINSTNIGDLDGVFIPTSPVNQELISDVDELLIDQYRFSDSLLMTDIPDEYKEFLYVELVDMDTITVHDRVIFKGYNKLGGHVYINDLHVVCDQNGYFSYDFSLQSYGKQLVYITFTTMDNRFITLEKKINYLYEPVFSVKDVGLKRSITYFYNSNFIYNIQDRDLNSPVTRADLAYFLMSLKQDSISNLGLQRVVNDVDKKDWYYDAVYYGLHEQLMGEFIDGNFYPSRHITLLELLVTLVRVVDVDLVGPTQIGSYHDFPKNHWASKFVSASLEQGFIKKSTHLYPDKTILLVDFIDIVRRMDRVKEIFSFVDSVDIGYQHDHDDVFRFLMPVVLYLDKTKRLNLFHLDISSHQSDQVVYTDTVLLQGQVFPSLPFFIESTVVTPNVMGEFSYLLSLEPGVNSMSIYRDQLSNTFRLLYLDDYSDLSGHWLQELASKLSYLELLQETDKFKPKEHISRYQFIVSSYPFFYPLVQSRILEEQKPQIELTELVVTSSIKISDIDTLDIDRNYLDFLIQNEVFSLYEETFFYPDRVMTRIEAVAAIVKFMSLIEPDYAESMHSSSFPFWDVPMSHWGRSFLEVAYNNRLISKNNNFYPDKLLTKDQLVAVLSKTNYAKKLLGLLFSND